MSKDFYGFVVNRVLVPMINEAINCVYEGLATPEDVDQMMKLGANHPMGPLSLADLIGLDIVLDIMETLYNGFDDSKYRPSSLLKQMCDAGYLGRKTGKGFFFLRGGGVGALGDLDDPVAGCVRRLQCPDDLHELHHWHWSRSRLFLIAPTPRPSGASPTSCSFTG